MLAYAVAALALAAPAGAQPARTIDARIGVHVVPLLTRVSPILQGESRMEAYVTQPTLLGTATALGGTLRLHAAVSLEGLTLDRGELGAGAHGEGYVDRRHPHTYLHELVLSGEHTIGAVAGSITVGRGFAAFGTDDPMMRPFVKFPVNHHLGQILERLIATAGVRTQGVVLEAGVFSGNEPIDAADAGSLRRFGDSWSARVTLLPGDGIELQASRAWVVSPELPVGGGWDQRKWSVSARYERPHALGSVLALVEWNRTTQVDHGTAVFSFGSVLAEAALDVHGWRPALRVEQAQRPEEQRTSDPFRTPWPHGGGHVLGITRWRIVAARIERAAPPAAVRVAPFVEVSYSNVAEIAGGIFDPQEFYGDTRIWTFNAGARIGAGWHPVRMGRYGVAAVAGRHAH